MQSKNKCYFCGAPSDINNSLECEYCGQSLNQNNKWNLILNQLLLKKKYIAYLFIVSAFFLSFLRVTNQNVQEVNNESNVENSMPIFPELPVNPPLPKETGKFVFYSDQKDKEHRAYQKYWCKKYAKNNPLSDCIKQSTKERFFFDIGSQVKFGSWMIFKYASSYGNEIPSTAKQNDVAINCEEKIIAYYATGYPDYYSSMKYEYPNSFDDNDEKVFKREKPSTIYKKIGQVWWKSDDIESDLEDGEYIAWRKQIVRDKKERLSKIIADKEFCGLYKEYKDQCTPEFYEEQVAFRRDTLQRSINDLEGDKLLRKAINIQLDKFFKSTCKKKY